MKALFIKTTYKKEIIIPEEIIIKLPPRVMLFTTVQFIEQLDSFKDQLRGKEVLTTMPEHTRFEGQILGCNIKKINGDFDAFLYIGDGLFHPKALAFKNELPIFIYNPMNGKFYEMTRDEIIKINKKEKGALLKFLSSDNIGIMISAKPGQYHQRKADELITKFPNKKFYQFITTTLDFNDIENYPFIDVFVNTMCPRIGLDDTNKINKPVINIDELLKLKTD